MRTLFRSAVRAALDIVSPRLCAGCDAELEATDLFCPECEAAGRPSFDSSPLEDGTLVVTSGPYRGALARAIRRLKYQGRPDLAAPLGRRLVNEVRGIRGSGPTVLVPVPLHPRKLSTRGYNQSALIAGELAAALGWPVAARALHRCRETNEQAKLGRSGRLENMRGAVAYRERLDGRCVVLVDDVLTTGATAAACVAGLRRAGATVLAVATVARASFFTSRPS